MKEGKLASFLNSVGYQANKWIRPTELHYIILETDGNQFFNPKLQKIYFDTTNEMIKIKYSDLKPITAMLKQFSYNESTKTLYFQNHYQSVYYKKSIREPKSGDKVCCYQPSTKTTTMSTINRVLTDQYGNRQIELLDDNIILTIKNTTTGLRFYIWLQEYTSGISLNIPTEYYTEVDLTSYDADIYLPTNRICGFDFEPNKWGL